MSQAVLQQALKLSVPERLKLMEEIWESIRANPATLLVTEAQKAELERRLANHAAEPEAGYSLEEVLGSLADKD